MLNIFIFFITLCFSHRYLPKTGGTHQREETWQVTQCGPWSSLSLWAWLWTCGIREQGLSGKPDLERPADCLPRWTRNHLFPGLTLRVTFSTASSSSSSQCCLSSSSLWVTIHWHCYLAHWSLYNPVIIPLCNLPLSCSHSSLSIMYETNVFSMSHDHISSLCPMVIVQRAHWMLWHAIFQPLCPLTARWLWDNSSTAVWSRQGFSSSLAAPNVNHLHMQYICHDVSFFYR